MGRYGQIRIDFQVTEQVKQCVYVYLIDSGVYGSERIISDYISNIGRDIPELKGIFFDSLPSRPYWRGGATEDNDQLPYLCQQRRAVLD